MPGRRKRGDETWNRLLNWTEALKASERLAGHILAAEGFVSIDPSHPLGGPDGLKDIVCERDGIRWVAACYFPNGKKPFSDVKSKFESDIRGGSENDAQGFAFVVNQYLTLRQRDQLKAISGIEFVEIIHLERIVNILNQPSFYGIRLEFLDIEMTKEEQVAFFGIVTDSMNGLRQNLQQVLSKLNESSLSGSIPTNELAYFKQTLESIVGNSYFVSSMFPPPITKLRVPLDELREFENTLNRLTGGPYSISSSFFTPPIKKLQVPLYELQEYEMTLNRILQKLEQAERIRRRLY